MLIETINDALKVLNRIEESRDALRAEYDKKESRLRAARDEVELFLLSEMKSLGLKSFELPGEGVATIKEKRRFGCADWSLLWQWVVANDCPHFLQKRLLDTAIQKYLDDNGTLPPAVNSEARLTIAVTKRG